MHNTHGASVDTLRPNVKRPTAFGRGVTPYPLSRFALR